jgi:predicted Zn-dependent peptidase
MFVECAQGVDPAELERVVAEELARMGDEKVSAAELKRARSILNASDAFDSETVSDLAEELGEWAVDLDWRLAFDGGAGHERITAEMLRAAVAEYLSPATCVTGWCLPRQAAVRQPSRATRSRSRSGARKRAAKR